MIVGGPVPGHEQYERSLKDLADELGLSSRLIMTGFRADVPALIAIFDVMLQLSIFDDPFPGVVLQGMAMEKTVAASNRGGVVEQIDDGVTGILIDPHDAAGAAQRLSELLQNAPERQRLGAAARRAVYHKFKDDAVIIKAIYDSLLNEIRKTASV
jgi:glycosyltransferase involved in cell wall biosynthesis